MGTTQQALNNADQLCWTAATAGTCAAPPAGATFYAYDTRGNRTRVTPPAGPTTTLTYDQPNRLTGYGTAATYSYNGDRLRMSKTVSGTTSQFLWDVAAGLPLLIKDGTTAYVYGPGDLPLEQVNGSTVMWLHRDQLGSTRLVTDIAGTNQATYAYDPYGNLVGSTGSITNPLRFDGQYQDTESGLYYLRARYYDPSTAQFLSRDPAVASTRQPYAYVSGNPLNGSDPTGLYDCGWQVWNCITNPFADPDQGRRNFVDNLQTPLGLGVVGPLAVAATMATAGLIWEGGSFLAGAGGSASALASRIDPNTLQNSATVASKAAERPFVNSILNQCEIMAARAPVLDPRGVPGVVRWYVPGSFNKSQGTFELVVDTVNNVVLHHNFVN